ncbi:hypothetical protein BDR26DRAFT_922243 [Obelidium mucronatum]|nr:hypothetical protein BDR26DRAFT_922243 [Obelidium mucronatum]
MSVHRFCRSPSVTLLTALLFRRLVFIMDSLHAGKTAVAYVRISKETNDNASLRQQTDFIKTFAAQNGFLIHGEFFADVESGDHLDCPGLQKALDVALRNKNIFGLITFKVDRLSRIVHQPRSIIESLISAGKFYFSASEPELCFGPGYDDANRRITLLLKSVVAEIERISISQNTRHHMLMKKLAGSPVCNKAPFGTRFRARYSDGHEVLHELRNQLSNCNLIDIRVVDWDPERNLAIAAIKFSTSQRQLGRTPTDTEVFDHVASLGMCMETRESTKIIRKHRRVQNFARRVKSFMKQLEEKHQLEAISKDIE